MEPVISKVTPRNTTRRYTFANPPVTPSVESVSTMNASRLAYADAVPLLELIADCTLVEEALPPVEPLFHAEVGPSPALVVPVELADLAAGMELHLG